MAEQADRGSSRHAHQGLSALEDCGWQPRQGQQTRYRRTRQGLGGCQFLPERLRLGIPCERPRGGLSQRDRQADRSVRRQHRSHFGNRRRPQTRRRHAEAARRRSDSPSTNAPERGAAHGDRQLKILLLPRYHLARLSEASGPEDPNSRVRPRRPTGNAPARRCQGLCASPRSQPRRRQIHLRHPALAIHAVFKHEKHLAHSRR